MSPQGTVSFRRRPYKSIPKESELPSQRAKH
jgi:hypothetical protein